MSDIPVLPERVAVQCKTSHATGLRRMCTTHGGLAVEHFSQQLVLSKVNDQCPQLCLEYAARNGSWLPGDGQNKWPTWQWSIPPGGPSCCNHPRELSSPAFPRWTLVLGDSRGRFLFSALVSLLNKTRTADRPPAGWPSHRVPVNTSQRHEPSARTWYATSPYKEIFRGDCTNNMLDARHRRGEGPCCVLDFQYGIPATSLKNSSDAQQPGPADFLGLDGVRLTFVWHARSVKTAWVSTSRTLRELSIRAGGRRPDALLLAIGAWDLLLSGGRWSDRARVKVEQSYHLALHSLSVVWPTPPALRVAYGNWPCPNIQHAWGNKRYSQATLETRDWYRNASLRAGYAWLDIEATLQRLPPMRSSPCGNQHPFGAIAEAHTRMFLYAAAGRETPR
mmetsp:Transcript_5943/g.13035  ORF Transcript_5943/g.13035 Transcript_5943/m.13035 type:complete len:392 (-) Transcript_5943:258-1433(-)|eukprot:3401825-Pleurochrysis_carterae.AAC.2